MRLSRARSASQSWTGKVRVTFTTDLSAAMKHIEDLSPKFGVEEMEVVSKVNEEVQGEEMDQGGQSPEERVVMDAEELEEGEVVGEEDEEELEDGEVDDNEEDKLEEGEIVDSDSDPGGQVTGDEEEDDARGYMGRGSPSDSEESVYPVLSAERAKSRVSFATSLTHSLEEAAVIGGNGVSFKYPDLEEEVVTSGAGSEARGHSLGARESGEREEEGQEDSVEDMEVAMTRKRRWTRMTG